MKNSGTLIMAIEPDKSLAVGHFPKPDSDERCSSGMSDPVACADALPATPLYWRHYKPGQQ